PLVADDGGGVLHPELRALRRRGFPSPGDLVPQRETTLPARKAAHRFRSRSRGTVGRPGARRRPALPRHVVSFRAHPVISPNRQTLRHDRRSNRAERASYTSAGRDRASSSRFPASPKRRSRTSSLILFREGSITTSSSEISA